MECTRRAEEPAGARRGAAGGVARLGKGEFGRATSGSSGFLGTVYCSLIVRSFIFSATLLAAAASAFARRLSGSESAIRGRSAKLAGFGRLGFRFRG